MTARPLKINLISESVYGGQGQGVHTAFVDMLDMLRRRPDAEVFVNSRRRCDVVHAHTFGPLYWLLGRGTRGRRVISAHVVPASMVGSLVGWRLWLPLFTRYIRLAYNRADVVVAVAPAVKRALAGVGVTARQEVVTNPVNLRKFRPDPALRARGRGLLKLSPRDKVALCVGQIQPRKGVEDFVLAARANPGVKFVWVGGRPFSVLTDAYAGMNRLMEQAPPNLRFAGLFGLDDMAALYNAADLFFFPSFQENCALAIAEAAACGLPLLLRDLEDYHELYGGQFLSARDTAGFSGQVRRFFTPRFPRKAWKAKSLKMVRRFDVEVLCERLMKIYRGLEPGA